jgi:hypothetical protein
MGEIPRGNMDVSLPLELDFEHQRFLAQVERMSFEQRGEMLATLHRAYLGHRSFIKTELDPRGERCPNTF